MKPMWSVYGVLQTIHIQAAIFSGHYPDIDCYEMAIQVIAENMNIEKGKVWYKFFLTVQNGKYYGKNVIA